MSNITKPIPELADAELWRRVVAYLASRHLTALRNLEVEARGGTVALSGKVQSMFTPIVLGERFMFQRLIKVRLFALGFVSLSAVYLAGCGSEGLERVPVVKVETKVLFEGQPLKGAFVVLHPKANVNAKALPARGYVDEQGVLKPTTYDEGDGVAPGEFAVTVEYRPLVQTADGVQAGPNVLPQKYATPQSTDLFLRVAEGTNEISTLNLAR